MSSNLDDRISQNGPAILKSLREAFGRPVIVNVESFDKMALLTRVLAIIADGIGAEYGDVFEIRLVPRFGQTLDTVDDGVLFSYDRLLRMMRSVDPTLQDAKKLNEYPAYYEQSFMGYTSPHSTYYGKDIKDEQTRDPRYYKQYRGVPAYFYREKKPLALCRDSAYMNGLMKADIEEGRAESWEELVDLQVGLFREREGLESSIEEIKKTDKFWRDYCSVAVPMVGIDAADGEEVILGTLIFSNFSCWDMKEPLSDSSGSLMQEFANAAGTVLATAYVANQWKLQNKALKAAQAKILEQEKIIVEQSMAGGFAHEVRNALSPITTYVAVLLGTESRKGLLDTLDFAEEDKQMLRDRLLKVRNQAEYALDITGMIMEYAKIESQQEFEEVKIKDLLETVLASHTDELRQQCISLTSSLAYDGPLYANPTQVRQVVENLLLNAEHAVEKTERKEITLMLACQNGPDAHSPKGDAVTISVADSGSGIDDAIRDKIFRPFFTTRPDKKGAGLGLATSRRIARLYGGDLTFESVPGKTTFTFIMPVGEKAEMEASADER